jgi:PIN domain nuclease of toxin-antitoxin system
LILLDTHVVIWLAQDHRRISSTAKSAIEATRDKRGGLAVSCITLVEIVRLARSGRIDLRPDVETVLSEIERRFVVLPITGNVALQAFELPADYPNDPVDRIIGATALVEDIPLITADREIRKSGAVPTIW